MEPEEQPAGKGPASRAPKSVSERLKAARAKSGLTIETIAERTRIPGRHLRALEEGRFQDLPAVAYSAGFARAFAQSVGLDGAAVASQYRAEAEPDPLPYYDQYEPLDPARVPSSGLAWVAAGAGALVVAVLIAFSMGLFSRGGDNVTVAASQPAPASEAAVSAPASVPPLSPPPVAAPSVPAQQAAGQVATGQVVLTASEDAWIKVYDRGGQTVRMGILKAGESYAVPGDPAQMLLWTGKAGAIKVTVGGKAVAPLGQPVQTVRDVSLAPDSLLARQAPPAPAG